MINQAIQIKSLANHLLCCMQCCLNGMQISESTTCLADSSSETTHVIQVVNPPEAIQQCIIMLELQGATSNFDVHSPIMAEFENTDSQLFSHCRRDILGPINRRIFRKRGLCDRSLKSDHHPCHNGQGTSVHKSCIMHS